MIIFNMAPTGNQILCMCIMEIVRNSENGWTHIFHFQSPLRIALTEAPPRSEVDGASGWVTAGH